MGPFFPVKEFLSQIIYEINHIRPAISDELILAGKLLVSRRHGFKPRRSLNLFQASFSAISLIAVYLRGTMYHPQV